MKDSLRDQERHCFGGAPQSPAKIEKKTQQNKQNIEQTGISRKLRK
jgi:hypothetical protein